MFSVCAPQYVMRPPVTQHVPLHSNHYVKIWHVRLGGGVANNMRSLSCGAQTEKIQKNLFHWCNFELFLSFCCKTNNQIHYSYSVGCKIFCSIIECWNFPIAVTFLWNGPSLFRETCFLKKNSAINESIISLLDPCIFFASLLIYPLHIFNAVSVCKSSQIRKIFWMLYDLKHSRALFKMQKVCSARSQNTRSCYLARSWILLTFVILKRARFVF